MKIIFLLSLLGLFSCTTRTVEERPGHSGASAAQSANQEAVDGISSPSMPANQLPPPGTPVVQPAVVP